MFMATIIPESVSGLYAARVILNASWMTTHLVDLLYASLILLGRLVRQSATKPAESTVRWSSNVMKIGQWVTACGLIKNCKMGRTSASSHTASKAGYIVSCLAMVSPTTSQTQSWNGGTCTRSVFACPLMRYLVWIILTRRNRNARACQSSD